MKRIFLLFPLFALSACRTETPNGQIPNDGLAAAQAAVGRYTGSIEGGTKGTLAIQLNGNRVTASFSGRLLSCGGRLGALQAVDGDGSRLSEAEFGLSGANCVAGRSVNFSATPDGRTLIAKVMIESHSETHCPSIDEVASCVSAVNRDDHCGSLEGQDYTDCETDNSQQSADCSACSEQTVGTYRTGFFRR